MDYDSPDWDRTPTESIEVKEETPHLIKAEADEPSTSGPKLELTKKEEDSPQHAPMLCPPVSAVPDKTSTTSTTPPAKAPPVSHTSYRNLSTRNTPQTNPKPTPTPHDAIPPHTAPAPPSTTSSTSTEDPVILTTNVPILPKARPGHPPINTTWVRPPQRHRPHPSTAPTRNLVQVTIPRPHRNGQLLPFNFSNDIKHHLNPTAHPTRRPVTSSPVPPSHFSPTTTTNTTTVFPPVPPIPDAPLTEQQAATLQQTILRIARQAAAAAAAELNSRHSSS